MADSTNTAFADDCFGRKRIAERLINQIIVNVNTPKKGRVITVNAPWGEGKTYFGNNLAKLLEEKHNSFPVYIDAFKHDYSDEPFVLISSAIRSRVKETGKSPKALEGFLNCAVQLSKRILPSVAGMGVSYITAGLLSGKLVSDKSEDIAALFSGVTENYFKEKIEEFDKYKNEIGSFHEYLEEIAKEHVNESKRNNECGLPLIVVIDELDRCAPTFAVKLIERVKHFFDVENVVFILLVNNKQLSEYFKGVYGQGIDAELYFEKFIDFSINLCNPNIKYDSDRFKYIEYKQRAASGCRVRGFDLIGRFLKTVYRRDGLSLRLIDKFYNYIELIDTRISKNFIIFVCCLILIKLLFPTEYFKFIDGDKDVCKNLSDVCFGNLNDDVFSGLLVVAVNLHLDKKHYTNGEDFNGYNSLRQICENENIEMHEVFIHAARYIDFKIYG